MYLRHVHPVFSLIFVVHLLFYAPFLPTRPTVNHFHTLLLTPLLLLFNPSYNAIRLSLILALLSAFRSTFSPPNALSIAPIIFYLAFLILTRNLFLPFISLLSFLYLTFRTPSSPETAFQYQRVPPNPFNASAFSLLTFQWVTPLVALATRRPLQPHDIPLMADKFTSNAVKQRFDTKWIRSSNGQYPSLAWTLTACFGPRLSLAAVFKLISLSCTLASPILLQQILRFLDSRTEDSPNSTGFQLALFLFATYIIQALSFHQYYDNAYSTQSQTRGALLAAVYSKTTLLSPLARQQFTVGQIQNLMSSDCRTVASVPTYFHDIWSTFLQGVASFLLLINLLGWQPAVGSVVFVVIFLPVQVFFVMTETKLRAKALKRTDERVKYVSEAIRAIKLIKLYAWEIPIINRILGERTKEIQCLSSIGFLNSINSVVIWTVYTVQIIMALMLYLGLGKPLSADVIFPTIALFDLFIPALLDFPSLITAATHAVTSLSRLNNFLCADEVVNVEQRGNAIDQEMLQRDELEIVARDVSLNWDPSSTSPTLSNISFSIPKGSLVAIIGATGSGKTALIAGLLREMQVTSGQLGVRNDSGIAYCHQTPFIQNATLRDNILFGKPYEEAFYSKVIKVCCLDNDLKVLPAGDLTEIGSRGINLSGGQRARVSFARAVYSGHRICMFDDPFSAVDTFVGNKLFQECLVSELRDRTRLFTTNQLYFASSPEVDLVMIVKHGTIVELGAPSELMKDKNSELSCLMKSTVHSEGPCDTKREDQHSAENQKIPHAGIKAKAAANELSTLVDEEQEKEYGSMESGKLVKAETKDIGRVKLKHYMTYIRAAGLFKWIIPLLIFVVTQKGFETSSGVWLGLWSDQPTTEHVVFNLSILICLSLLAIVFKGISDVSAVYAMVQASTTLHKRLLVHVFGAPIRFFNSVPDGRLINRFSSDVDKTDNSVGPAMYALLNLVVSLLCSIGLILWAFPQFVVMVAIVGALCLLLQEYYRKSVVDLRRLESVAYSPLYSHFSETLDGVSTIRAYQNVGRCRHAHSLYADDISRTVYSNSLTRRWFGVRMMGLGAMLIFGATVLAIYTPNKLLSTGVKGIVLTHTIALFGRMRQTVKQLTNAEAQLNAVERMSEYSDKNFAQEEEGAVAKRLAADKIDGKASEKQWPKAGVIEFENVEMRYREDLAPALSNVSFSIGSGEHIGIVGRTGAGKTSAIQCLFRLHELSKGRILIDGVDICTVDLHTLRRSLGVIPQEAVCFSGNIRSNLDMFGEHSDCAIERALDLCGLAECMSTKVTLEYEISENGENLSVGQRQLLCLGRALLKDKQIVVLDEATSSVSMGIDKQMQKVIGTEMKRCTVVTVAHRLQTVMKSDRMIVMDGGRVVESGSPRELLRRDSALKRLVEESGAEEADRLYRMAVSD